ncbi:hypothetical protein EJ08DRAFT_44769 [Tothia fuscella]|uniref:Uncharacterized protein n=1 Tax=Tothia fuscella TaxID=1048955 RepID=A0A9P4TTD3_9PEZI|nr:hypothetical protein EJ08DRAFT_44769 [Tothia fuscella]
MAFQSFPDQRHLRRFCQLWHGLGMRVLARPSNTCPRRNSCQSLGPRSNPPLFLRLFAIPHDLLFTMELFYAILFQPRARLSMRLHDTTRVSEIVETISVQVLGPPYKTHEKRIEPMRGHCTVLTTIGNGALMIITRLAVISRVTCRNNVFNEVLAPFFFSFKTHILTLSMLSEPAARFLVC